MKDRILLWASVLLIVVGLVGCYRTLFHQFNCRLTFPIFIDTEGKGEAGLAIPDLSGSEFRIPNSAFRI
jgi:hypothetical protein